MDSNSEVKNFWEEYSCGEKLYLNGIHKKDYEEHSSKRYKLEPYIINFLKFDFEKNSKILEIGVGLGADHQKIVEQGYDTFGIDLTQRAVDHTINRLYQMKLSSNINIGNAESLNFEDCSFNGVYAWGVIHHSHNPKVIISEIYRVLKTNGQAKIMMYNKHSITVFMLWFRYAFLKCKPWISFSSICHDYLESPGTKVYSKAEIKLIFKKFKSIYINTVLSHADLLSSEVGQRHRGIFLKTAKILWPRKLIKVFLSKFGLFMLIELEK
jgi:ubiquinone/menaquinone biosynthesis C-methylase UbiE